MKLERLEDIHWIVNEYDKKLSVVAYACANYDIAYKCSCHTSLNQLTEIQRRIDRVIKSRNRP